MACVSFGGSGLACALDRVDNSVFCKKHYDAFHGQYNRYKKLEKTIAGYIMNNNLSNDIYELIRIYSLIHTVYEKRVTFRQNAIHPDHWDVGHEIRIRILWCSMNKYCNAITTTFKHYSMESISDEIMNPDMTVTDDIVVKEQVREVKEKQKESEKKESWDVEVNKLIDENKKTSESFRQRLISAAFKNISTDLNLTDRQKLDFVIFLLEFQVSMQILSDKMKKVHYRGTYVRGTSYFIVNERWGMDHFITCPDDCDIFRINCLKPIHQRVFDIYRTCAIHDEPCMYKVYYSYSMLTCLSYKVTELASVDVEFYVSGPVISLTEQTYLKCGLTDVYNCDFVQKLITSDENCKVYMVNNKMTSSCVIHVYDSQNVKHTLELKIKIVYKHDKKM